MSGRAFCLTRTAIAGLLAAVIVAVPLASCASTRAKTAAAPFAQATAAASAPAAGFPLAAAGSSFGASGLSDFAKENLGSFSTFTLSNGLPVIVKKSSANSVRHISLIIRGGSAAEEKESAGYESLALRVMARGSAAYSYDDIRSLLDETSSSLGSSSDFDYSAYSLSTLDKYFDRLLPIWVDTIVNPSFRESDFEQELSQAKLALESREQDPWSRTGFEADRILFAGHPYAASPEGTKESLASIKLEDALAWYKARIAAPELFVVAVGDFDPAALHRNLETGLGKLPSEGAPLPPPPPALRGGAKGSLDLVEFPASKGMGYLRGDFAAPGPADPDYLPLNLGVKALSDLLFNVVRDKYGAAYSPDAYIRSYMANYGTISLFKTKDPGKAKAYIDEAVAILASGRTVAVDPDKYTSGYEPISEVLEAEKAQFLNGLYESQATNGAIADFIARSVIGTGDYRSYLLYVDRIKAVTATQIAAALDKYLLKGTISWVALGSSDVLASSRAADYETFTPARTPDSAAETK